MIGLWLFAGSGGSPPGDEGSPLPEGDTPVASPHDKGSYPTYWVLEDKHKEHFDWAGNQVVDLYINNRGFMERQHAHTVLLSNPEHAYRDDDPVPIEPPSTTTTSLLSWRSIPPKRATNCAYPTKNRARHSSTRRSPAWCRGATSRWAKAPSIP